MGIELGTHVAPKGTEIRMRDIYDWDSNDTDEIFGFVSPAQMHELHRAGMARSFKVSGQINITVTWVRGDTVGSGAVYLIA